MKRLLRLAGIWSVLFSMSVESAGASGLGILVSLKVTAGKTTFAQAHQAGIIDPPPDLEWRGEDDD